MKSKIIWTLTYAILAMIGIAARSEQPAVQDPSEAYVFTNEMGHRINLADFSGQALAINFIFTRCPMPQYCPRLSKNFAEATQKLSSMTNVSTNWHFFSISIDPEFDTPEVLKRYGERYQYDSKHWSFLTGPNDRVQGLGKLFGMKFDPDGNLMKHTFRTVVINRSNIVQQIIPVAGDFSEELVQEMVKALGRTNQAE